MGFMSESLKSQALMAVSTLLEREDATNPAHPGTAYQSPSAWPTVLSQGYL